MKALNCTVQSLPFKKWQENNTFDSATLTINLSLSQFPSKVSFKEKKGNEV